MSVLHVMFPSGNCGDLECLRVQAYKTSDWLELGPAREDKDDECESILLSPASLSKKTTVG